MGMQIDVDETTWDLTIRDQTCTLIKLAYCLLCCVDSGVHRWIWVFVEAIQILIQSVLSVIPSKNSIRVQTWYDLEYKAISK